MGVGGGEGNRVFCSHGFHGFVVLIVAENARYDSADQNFSFHMSKWPFGVRNCKALVYATWCCAILYIPSPAVNMHSYSPGLFELQAIILILSAVTISLSNLNVAFFKIKVQTSSQERYVFRLP